MDVNNEIKYDSIRNTLEKIKDIEADSPMFKEIIVFISSLQKLNGSFDIINERLPNDINVYYNNESSYICTELYMKAFLHDKEWFEENIGVNNLKLALDFCSVTNFWGHGYEGLEIQLKTMKLFLKNYLNCFLSSYPEISSSFTEMIEKIISNYHFRINNQDFWYGFGNYEKEIKEVIFLYEIYNFCIWNANEKHAE